MSELTFAISKTNNPKIDTDARIIRDVIMAEVGEAKGWRVYVEEEFIDACVEYAQRYYKDGVPCEFGHNYEGMGKQLGLYKNVRKQGKKMIGDLHIYAIADESPTHPKMGAWLLGIAKENKKVVNSSIKFYDDGYYQRDNSGAKIKVYYYSDEGRWVSSIKEYGKVFISFKKLTGCDIVSKGALTNKLFSSHSLLNKFQEIMNDPEFIKVLEIHYEEMPILSEFFNSKLEPSMLRKFKELFYKPKSHNLNVNDMAKNEVTPDQESSDYSKQFNELKEEVKSLKETLKKYQSVDDPIPSANDNEEINPSPNDFSELINEVKSLRKEVSELSKKPAAETTSLPIDTTPVVSEKSYMNLDIHQRLGNKK